MVNTITQSIGPTTHVDPSKLAPPGTSNNEPMNVDRPLAASPSFILDKAKPLEPRSFPNQPRDGNSQIPTTIPNVKYLLTSYGINVQYDAIKKKLSIKVPGQSGAPDNADNVAMAQIISLANLNGMSTGSLPSFVAVIGDRNQFNPVSTWITSKPWDGVDRLQAFYETLVHREGYPVELKQKLMYRWLLSAVAAALKPSGFRARGVLTLQGPQSIGKTAWVSALVPDPVLREVVVKLDHHLDAGNKDSLIGAITHWIVEIGELDSSFKKDIARLKGFLTGIQDKVRRPYGRTDSEYPRKTVFCATVNDHDFLPDSTGNSRFWTIPVTKINYAHGMDMQQIFAQIAVDFEKAEPWWLTPDEELMLEEYNKSHRSISAIRERVLDAIDLERRNQDGLPAMTPTELLSAIGIKNPTNSQCKECAAVLREFFGEFKRINGQNRWRVSLKRESWSAGADIDDAKF